MTRAENQPVYVHCNAGKGRTGIFVGVYRMAVEGWPPEKAFEEARQYGVNDSKLEFFKQVQGWLDSGEMPRYAAVRRAPLDEAHLETMQLHPSSAGRQEVATTSRRRKRSRATRVKYQGRTRLR